MATIDTSLTAVVDERAEPNGLVRVGQNARRRGVLPIPQPVQRAIGPVLLLIAWQIETDHPVLGRISLPGPADVASTGYRLIADGELPQNLLASLSRVGEGLAIGLAAGLVLAIASGLFRLGENLIDANMAILRAIPHLALLPIFIIWFGIDNSPKVMLIAVGASVQIYLTTFGGIRGVDQGLVEAMRSFGVRRLGLIRLVVLPGALPGFLTGLRFALTGAWLSLIFAETLNARLGLGRMMNDATDYSELNVVFVVIVVYALLGLACHAFVNFLEGRLLTWRRTFVGDR